MPGSRWPLVALMLLAALTAARVCALDLTRHLSQFHHTSWTMESGAPPDVWALAQSPDGYLWLGTGAGLFRFDGVRFEKPVLPAGQRLPSSNITALFADRSGDIWIGFVSGAIARLRGGSLQTFGGLSNDTVNQIAIDRAGTMWAAVRGYQKPGLRRFDGRRWTNAGAEWGLPNGSAVSVLGARNGAVWVNVADRLFVLRPRATRFVEAGVEIRHISCIAEAPGGDIWVSSDATGRPRLVDGPSFKASRQITPPPAPEHNTGRMIIDHDGSLWGTYEVGGLYRAASYPVTGSLPERFSLSDGLSSDIARPVLEDREGNIWVGTNLGLDRFRATSIFSASSIPPTSRRGFYVAAAANGTVLATAANQIFTIASDGSTVSAQLNDAPSSLMAGADSSAWIGVKTGLLHFGNGRLEKVRLPGPSAEVVAIVEAPRGELCVSLVRVGIACRNDGIWSISRFMLDAGHVVPLQTVRASTGALWLNYEDALGVIEHGILRRFSAVDGPRVGIIGIVADGPLGILVGGDFGLARYDGKRFVTLTSDRYPLLSRISGAVQTSAGTTWLNGIKGAIRIDNKDLARAFERPDRPLKMAHFDMKDGLPGVAQQDSDTPTVVEARDGKLWFVTSHGVAWLDPRKLSRNSVIPPVLIRAVIGNGRSVGVTGPLKLAGGTSNLEIDYTALSLSIPERVRFRYRLSGIDDGWVDPGTRREAYYTKLGPGDYRFQVIAANNDGVWNRTGATVNFTIAPTFVQSVWFKLLLAAIALPTAWAIYSLRVRFLTDQVKGRLEERLDERERIARELHDTLLQGFQGLVFRFQAANERLARDNPARELIDNALDQADAVLVEGRNRVMDLRAEAQVATIADRVAASAKRILDGSATEVRIIVEGKPRRLHPLAEEESVRVAEEVLSNAVRHARADCIEISLTYRSTALHLHVRDNGVGIDPDVLSAGGRGNHYGLLGMRERADRIGGALTISSQPGAGTEVSLVVPAQAAYARPNQRRRRFFDRLPPTEG